MTVLQTARVRLRPLQVADAAAISALMTPNVSRWVATWPSPFSIAAATERLTRAIAANAAGTAFSCIAERTATMGYWLGEAFHGQGYLSEILRPFVAGAISALQLNHLDAGAQVDNAASLAALRRLGMRFVEERMDQTPIRPDPERCAFYRLDCRSFVV